MSLTHLCILKGGELVKPGPQALEFVRKVHGDNGNDDVDEFCERDAAGSIANRASRFLQSLLENSAAATSR